MSEVGYASLGDVGMGGRVRNQAMGERTGERLTVDVMSTEQTSHMYLTPPSLPRVAVFFLMTAIAAADGRDGDQWHGVGASGGCGD